MTKHEISENLDFGEERLGFRQKKNTTLRVYMFPECLEISLKKEVKLKLLHED